MQRSTAIAIALALTTACFSGVSGVVAKVAVTVVKDPIALTFLRNSVVAITLLGILIVTLKLKEVRKLTRRDAIRLAAIGIIGGSVPFILFFTGLAQTTSVSASFIHKTLFLWVAVLAVPLLKERIGKMQIAAFALLFGGNLVLGGLSQFHFGRGEWLILAATLFWSVEQILAKKTLAKVSPMLVAGSRMILGSVVLFGVVAWQGKLHLISGLTGTQWLWTLLPAALLLGYVATWFSALKRLPASTTAALLVPASIITTMLSTIFLDHTLTARELISAGFMATAVVLLVVSTRNHARYSAHPQPDYTHA